MKPICKYCAFRKRGTWICEVNNRKAPAIGKCNKMGGNRKRSKVGYNS